MLLRKDGPGVIAIPQPSHAWLSGQMARLGQRALHRASATRGGLPRGQTARHRLALIGNSARA
jgi:hypothetical protein